MPSELNCFSPLQRGLISARDSVFNIPQATRNFAHRLCGTRNARVSEIPADCAKKSTKVELSTSKSTDQSTSLDVTSNVDHIADHTNKQKFMSIKNYLPYKMSADDLRKMVKFYKEKKDIDLFVNGHVKAYIQPDEGQEIVSAASAMQEGFDLAGSSKNKFIGYFFNSGRVYGSAHVETLIFNKKGECFNIVPYFVWGTYALFYNVHHDGKPNKYFICPVATQDECRLTPQATGEECASLGLAYAKNYLQNNAQQLREFTLKIYPDKKKSTIAHLLCSPQVLRYAQSSFYCQLVYHFVSSSEKTITVCHNKKSATIKTLTGFIADGAVIKTIEGARLSSAALIQFRHKWLTAYEQSMEKRAAMNGGMQVYAENNSRGFNYYLAYVSNRHREKVEDINRLLSQSTV